MARCKVRVNGHDHELEIAGTTTLLEVLRDELGLLGAKYGCGEGQCGACCVLVDGRSEPSCMLRAAELGTRAVVTVEALDAPGPTAIQDAFVAEGAMQCGYCTAGMVIAATELLARVADPSDEQIVEALDRHLCRCGVYERVIRAVHRAARGPR